jgi:hypothetical protein
VAIGGRQADVTYYGGTSGNPGGIVRIDASLTFALQSSFAGEARDKSNACTSAVVKTAE